jgi:hypothetical protein
MAFVAARRQSAGLFSKPSLRPAQHRGGGTASASVRLSPALTSLFPKRTVAPPADCASGYAVLLSRSVHSRVLSHGCIHSHNLLWWWDQQSALRGTHVRQFALRMHVRTLLEPSCVLRATGAVRIT